MSLKAMSAVWECSALTSSQKLVSLYIADKVNAEHGYQFWGSKANCIKYTSLARKAVFKAFKDLETKGFIKRIESKKGETVKYQFIVKQYELNAIAPSDIELDTGGSSQLDTGGSSQLDTGGSSQLTTQYQEQPKVKPNTGKVSKKTVFDLHKKQVIDEKTEQVIERYNHLVKYLRCYGIDKQPLLEHKGKVLQPNHSTQLAINNFLANHTIEEWEAYIKGLADHRRELFNKTWINCYTNQEQTWDLKLLLNNYEKILNNQIN